MEIRACVAGVMLGEGDRKSRGLRRRNLTRGENFVFPWRKLCVRAAKTLYSRGENFAFAQQKRFVRPAKTLCSRADNTAGYDINNGE